jgi:hypothetical protein
MAVTAGNACPGATGEAFELHSQVEPSLTVRAGGGRGRQVDGRRELQNPSVGELSEGCILAGAWRLALCCNSYCPYTNSYAVVVRRVALLGVTLLPLSAFAWSTYARTTISFVLFDPHPISVVRHVRLPVLYRPTVGRSS